MLKPGFWYCGALLLALAVTPRRDARAQAVPNPSEWVESLVTFGAQSDTQWGGDNLSQTGFFLMPAIPLGGPPRYQYDIGVKLQGPAAA